MASGGCAAGESPIGRNGRVGCRRLPTYRDAVDFLESLVRTPPRTRQERERLGLAPIEALLDGIGNPHHAVAAIHVTGSKGKGSTALYTEALLSAAALRTGTFTSPHLEDWTERIRVAGKPIDRSDFVDAMERVRPAVAALHDADANAAPAFFDALVAASYSIFAGASVEIAVMEAGIGARLDPTRTCRAVATCITGVELEHADRLGPTIAHIAREKAAIARPGVPLVAGSMPETAWNAVEREAARTGAPVLRLGRDFAIRHAPVLARDHPRRRTSPRSAVVPAGPLGGTTAAEIVLPSRTIRVRLRQPGRHMLENAALALALAQEAGALQRLDDASAAAALEATVLPGRSEVLGEAPLVVADGAHTPGSIEALVDILDANPASVLAAVVSVTRGKDAARVLAPLVGRADTVIATAAEPSRSLPAETLADVLCNANPRASIECIGAPADALRAAARFAGRDGTVCATGSMYMAGAARRILGGDGQRHTPTTGSP